MLLSVLALAGPLLAEPATQASEVPPEVRRLVPALDRGVTLFPFPNSRLALLAVSLSSQECRLNLLEIASNGEVKVLTQQTVGYDWTAAYTIEVLPLTDSPQSGLAVAQEGSTIFVLIFEEGLRTPARVFSYYAGDEASPFSLPGYALQRQEGKLVIVEEYSQPTGFGSEGETTVQEPRVPYIEPYRPPALIWNGETFVGVGHP